MNKIKFILVAAGILLALAFTFSCSSSDGGGDTSQLSSSETEASSDSSVGEESSSSQVNMQGQQYFLGYGYDVIKSSYINSGDVKKLHPVLDQKRMINDGIIASDKISVQGFETFIGGNLTKFYEERNERIGLNLSASVPFKGILFSGKFETEFGVSLKENGINEHAYLRGRSHHYTHNEYISQGRATAERLIEYLSEGFAADLRSKTAAQILDRYGSHVFIQYYKGGAMEYNYAYYGTELSNSTVLSSALSASLSIRTIIGASVGVSSDLEDQKKYLREQLDSSSVFRSHTYGGTFVNISRVDQIEINYNAWLNSIEDKADICGIGKFDENFISVWELAAAGGELVLASELEKEFLVRVKEQEDNLRTKKGLVEMEKFTTIGTHSLFFDKGFPATVEIYALGAGGGGQGGYANDNMAASHAGTGGGGGGGSAAYAKFSVLQPTTFAVTVGGGGVSGSYVHSPWAMFSENFISTGDPGGNGGNTSVSWDNDIVTASGGRGGGMLRSSNEYDITGGTGGTANAQWPAGILDYLSEPGKNGSNGVQKSNNQIIGGNAASISVGSLYSFGGGLGAVRQNNSGSEAELGGGGAGGYDRGNGTRGGNGEVRIVITYGEDL